jgi:hypothetical protein
MRSNVRETRVDPFQQRDVATPLRRLQRALTALSFVALAGVAHADLTDEIQVYDDSINRPREIGLELHVNTTLDGRSQAEYPREIPPNHGLRTTMEWSYGLSESLEAGLYLPFLRDAAGTAYFAGPKVRMKWLPLRPAEGAAGMFAGLNVEVAVVNDRLEPGRPTVELRPIIGFRNPQWLIAFNPAIEESFRSRYTSTTPDFSPGLKVARKLTSDIALGLEYYNDFGPIDHFDRASKQSQQVFLALDFDGKPVPFNLGIGRGLNAASDKWTLKAIFEVPL